MGKSGQTQAVITALPSLLPELLQWIADLGIVGKGLSAGKVQSKRVGDGDYTTLYQDAGSKAREHFSEQLNYAYNGANSVPPQALPGFPIGFSEDFWSAEANDLAQIQAGINTALNDSDTPKWAQARMTNDILSSIDAYVTGSMTNAFLAKAFRSLYTDPNDASMVLQSDMCWVYCSTQAPDPNDASQNVNTLFLYSIGVCYMASNWPNRMQDPNPGIPVVRIGFAFSTMAIGIAIASFIFAAKDRPANINATISYLGLSATLVLSTMQPPSKDPSAPQPDIPYQWVLEQLTLANIPNYAVTQGLATADEATEIGLLTQWENADIGS
jgi:hypothetical protein